jgi:hypothetical protein
MRIAVIDTGIDTNHQSLNDIAFEYALAQLAEQKGMSVEAYVESLDLLDAEEIARVAGNLHVSVDADAAHIKGGGGFAAEIAGCYHTVFHNFLSFPGRYHCFVRLADKSGSNFFQTDIVYHKPRRNAMHPAGV